jgi:hypothetical protein
MWPGAGCWCRGSADICVQTVPGCRAAMLAYVAMCRRWGAAAGRGLLLLVILIVVAAANDDASTDAGALLTSRCPISPSDVPRGFGAVVPW